MCELPIDSDLSFEWGQSSVDRRGDQKCGQQGLPGHYFAFQLYWRTATFHFLIRFSRLLSTRWISGIRSLTVVMLISIRVLSFSRTTTSRRHRSELAYGSIHSATENASLLEDWSINNMYEFISCNLRIPHYSSFFHIFIHISMERVREARCSAHHRDIGVCNVVVDGSQRRSRYSPRNRRKHHYEQ